VSFVSGFGHGPRLYRHRASKTLLHDADAEDTMNALITKTAAAAAAAVTTITLFAAVASLADSDRTALMMAKSQPTQVAAR
jgi:hypothetical protein